ncbi:hypothetical protein HGA34_05480 [Candidatus Falkowbacteria bacterium]|nr:hypothetical protein [Candidatus Falkowbacteria bacterium]
MIKKIVTFSLFVFVSAVTGILIAGFLVSRQKCDTPSFASVGNDGLMSATGTASAGQIAPTETTLSVSEVAKHNNPKDCWQIVDGKVYNFTSYMNQHPGGVGTIIPYCGKEATSAFSSKGNQGSNHSDFAWNLLNKYLVGSLDQKIASSVVATQSKEQVSGQGAAPLAAAKVETAPLVSKASAPTSNGVALTSAEISKHNSISSCWLVVSGKIYDVSSYLNKHPAGARAITPYCGKEATAAFSGTNGGHVHSSYAWTLLGKFYVGTVGQQSTASAVEQAAQQAQTAAQQAPAGGDDEEEFEDD